MFRLFSILISFIALSFTISSCKKPVKELDMDTYLQNKFFGNAKMNLEGTNYKLYPYANKLNTDSSKINIGLLNYNDWQIDISLGFIIDTSTGNKRLYKQTSPLNLPCNTGLAIHSGTDIICTAYDVDETDTVNNYFILDSYDRNSKEIRGRFRLNMIRNIN